MTCATPRDSLSQVNNVIKYLHQGDDIIYCSILNHFEVEILWDMV